MSKIKYQWLKMGKIYLTSQCISESRLGLYEKVLEIWIQTLRAIGADIKHKAMTAENFRLTWWTNSALSSCSERFLTYVSNILHIFLESWFVHVFLPTCTRPPGAAGKSQAGGPGDDTGFPQSIVTLCSCHLVMDQAETRKDLVFSQS